MKNPVDIITIIFVGLAWSLLVPDAASQTATPDQRTWWSECGNDEPTSCRLAGQSYRTGGTDLNATEHRIDLPAARHLFEEGCKLNDAESCIGFAEMTRYGEGGETNLVSSRSAYKKACSDSVPEARLGCLEWGDFANEGLGGMRDSDEAKLAYQLGCDRGHVASCTMFKRAEYFSLPTYRQSELYTSYQASLSQLCQSYAEPRACLYFGASLMEKDGFYSPVNAVQAYSVACAENLLDACFALASMARDGIGMDANLDGANDLFQQLCDRGDSRACAEIAP